MAMCGRYSLGKKPKALPETQPFMPRVNIAPSQEAPVLIQDGTVKMMRWGLVPQWAADDKEGAKRINARSETLASKPSFKGRLVNGRCAVPADSFYEWRREGTRKTPFRFVLRDEEPFFFAGLWDRWRRPDGNTLESFSIITTEANDLVRSIHDRMPVILTEAAASEWVKAGAFNPSLLKPFASEGMDHYPISTRINDAKVDDAECIRRLNDREELLPGFNFSG